ncbi:MAG: hypothetical protein K2L86_03030 [Lachnospiraceae bacterium]|nr:hypothetical protein [Lachnospiraceae bacterium]
MRIKRFLQYNFFTIVCLSLLNGCADTQKTANTIPSTELPEEKFDVFMRPEETANVSESSSEDEPSSEADQTISMTDHTVVEIYADKDAISIPPDMMTASVEINKILRGEPILYDRFQTDNKIFEWLISDHTNEDNCFQEDAVLLISYENDTDNLQIIHTEAEGGFAHWVSAENKFVYTDVNFDGLPDLLICSGHHGAQGALSYYCFLQTTEGFAESPTFTDIPNPAIDAENKLILSQWRNSAASHSWAEYAYENHSYILKRELREQAEYEGEQTIWIWTVNDIEIGRSSRLTDDEIADLLYTENSDWQIAGDRWRTLYNNGLITDYSIYSEP